MNINSFTTFRTLIWDFYRTNGRHFIWRNIENPYYVLVSEIMLQQTQTYRVAPKFEQFILEFPTIYSLAEASLRSVLGMWQGLGYNRRGKFLHETAKEIVNKWNGIIPNDPVTLVTFPGIGTATASSITAFAYNIPTVFIETNIRTVFIHHFFSQQEKVHDKEIMPLIAATVDQENPREWYYALMDYGVMLKQTLPNPSKKSIHHASQSKFEGSDRQIRGAIIKLLTEYELLSKEEIIAYIGKDPVRVERIIDKVALEGLIRKDGSILQID